MSFGAGVYINVVDMDVIFQMELVSMYLDCITLDMRKTLSKALDWHNTG
jgi:hypothetical protein